jgi:hypothetical protein
MLVLGTDKLTKLVATPIDSSEFIGGCRGSVNRLVIVEDFDHLVAALDTTEIFAYLGHIVYLTSWLNAKSQQSAKYSDVILGFRQSGGMQAPWPNKARFALEGLRYHAYARQKQLVAEFHNQAPAAYGLPEQWVSEDPSEQVHAHFVFTNDLEEDRYVSFVEPFSFWLNKAYGLTFLAGDHLSRPYSAVIRGEIYASDDAVIPDEIVFVTLRPEDNSSKSKFTPIGYRLAPES